MKNNTLMGLILLLGIAVAWLEAVWIFPWLWLVFLPLAWKLNLGAKSWQGIVFALGLVRDLFKGSSLGKSSFFFLLIMVLFFQLTNAYRKR